MVKQSFEDGTVRIGPVAAVPSILSTFNVDPARVLAQAGLDIKMFAVTED